MKYLLSFFVFLFLTTSQVYAVPATLSFDPSDIKIKNGQEIQVNINMFTGNEAVASTDIMINYDKSLLEPIPNSTKNGTIFQTIDTKIISPGKLYIYGVQENKNEFVKAQGTVATVSFKTLKAGTTQLSFDCNPVIKNTSQIIKGSDSFQNIISCPSTIAHISSISIAEGTVLGAYADTYGKLNTYTAIFGILVAVFTFFVFLKYQRLKKNI